MNTKMKYFKMQKDDFLKALPNNNIIGKPIRQMFDGLDSFF